MNFLSGLLSATPDRRLIPADRFRGPTPWLIAIMSFAVVIVAAAALALSNAAATVTAGAQARFAVQLPDPARMEAARAALSAMPGVTSLEAVPEAALRETLRQWLGPAADAPDLPVPALLTFDAGPAVQADAVQRNLARVAPGARVTGYDEQLGPLLHSLDALRWLAWLLVATMTAAMSAAVMLAARGALDTHRSVIDVMHGIGATDAQVTALVQRKIAADAFVGSIAGGLAAALALGLVALAGLGGRDLLGTPPLGPLDLFVLVLLPFLLALLASWVARAAVLAALRRVT